MELMKLKLQATRALLRQKDLANLTEEQLPKELPETLRKELAQLGKMRAGRYRTCSVFQEVERSDGLELTADMWDWVNEYVREDVRMVVGDEVETLWEEDEGKQVWSMMKATEEEEGYYARNRDRHMNIFQWGQARVQGEDSYGGFEDGRMVQTWWTQEAPPRLMQVHQVYVDSRDNLVVCDQFINWVVDEEGEEIEVKMVSSVKFRRIE